MTEAFDQEVVKPFSSELYCDLMGLKFDAQETHTMAEIPGGRRRIR